MDDEQTPTDEQLSRALARSAASPPRRDWDTAGEWRRLRARIAADDAAGTHDTRRAHARYAPPRRWLAAAGLVVVAIGGVVTARRVAAPSVLTVATVAGQRRSLRLDDGTRVMVGPSSSLRVTLSRRERRVELTGLAQFRVAHDGARRFVVRAGEAETTDLGTVFTVRAFPDDDAVMVGVTEGHVSLRARGDSLVLAAGQSGRADSAGVRRTPLAASTLDAWATGQLVFRDATVAAVARDLARWFGADVRIDERLASRRVSGSYANPELGSVVAAMARAAGARVDRVGGAYVLRVDSSRGAR
jgi:transmembrane sensor